MRKLSTLLICFLTLLSCESSETIIEDFESGNLTNWLVENSAFSIIPNSSEYQGALGTFLVSSKNDEFKTGKMTSYAFEIKKDYINFLIGRSDEGTRSNNIKVNLLVDGKVVRTNSPIHTPVNKLSWETFEVKEFIGQKANIEIIIGQQSFSRNGGSSFLIDHFEMSDKSLTTYIGSQTIRFVAKDNILLIPSQNGGITATLTITGGGRNILGGNKIISLAQDKIDYYIPIDIREYRNFVLEVTISNLDSGFITMENIKQVPNYLFDVNEPYRPMYHYSPYFGWSNDPNGLVYYDGEYHLSYQANIYGMGRYNTQWGHAISQDLVHWINMPATLLPDHNGNVFAGSCVVDIYNSAGFGKDAIIALYTSSGSLGQNQNLAYSTNKGRSFTKYAYNPVISETSRKEFRGPNVIRYGDKWVAVIGSGKVISFYESNDLIDWTFLSEFGKGVGSHASSWECPVLIPMEYNGVKKWVLLASIYPGGPNGGSITQYFIGDFDGYRYKADPLPYPLWIDEGMDNHAGSVFSNTGDRTIFMGWMSNWYYASNVPIRYFKTAMTIPRDLKLKHNGTHLFLASTPARELNALRREVRVPMDIKMSDTFISSKRLPTSGSYELRFTIVPSDNQRTSLRLYNNIGEEIVFSFDFNDMTLTLDRSHSGIVDFHKSFGKSDIKTSLLRKNEYNVRLFMDRHSSEMFINDGDLSFTNIMFPSVPFTSMDIFSEGKACNVHSIEICELY